LVGTVEEFAGRDTEDDWRQGTGFDTGARRGMLVF
jgi:hypothetical protein